MGSLHDKTFPGESAACRAARDALPAAEAALRKPQRGLAAALALCTTGATRGVKPGSIALLLLMVACALHGAGAAPPTVQSPAEPAADIQQAETEARARHTRALQDCMRTQQQATCVRDADAKLHETLRDTAGERQRGATPPAPTAQDAQRVQHQRLFRELERAAPKPLPSPRQNPPDR
jgi:hypothetical protein